MENRENAEANHSTPIRVLHVLPTLEYGGIAVMLRDFYRHIDKSKIQFDFVHFGKTVPYHDELKKMGARIITMPTIGQAGIFGYSRKLKEIFAEYGPFATIHIHMNYMAGFIAYLARVSGIKNRICHMRGVYIRSGMIKLFLPFFRYMIRRNATIFFAVNSECGRYYYGKHPFAVIHNAVNLDEYTNASQERVAQVRQEIGISNGILSIGHVARFSTEKNHAFLVGVASQLKRKGIPFKMCFAGDGPLMQQTQDLFAAEGLAGYASFLGNRADVPDLMNVFDVTVLPSISEGLPNVVMQSQAAGTPCVLSSSLTHEVDIGLGLLSYCSLDDAEKWAESIVDAAKAGKQSAREIVEAFTTSGFEIKTAVAGLERIYLKDGK